MDKSSQNKLKQARKREIRNKVIVAVVCVFMILTMFLPYLSALFS